VIREELSERVIDSCAAILEDHPLVAMCLYGSRVSGYARKDSDYDILLVLQDYAERVRYHYHTVGDLQLAVLAVDEAAIEQDAKRGALGDFVVGRLLPPYHPLRNPERVKALELTTKKRFVKEDLDDLIIEYGELSRGLLIQPEYLVLARMEKRSKAYPPLRYSYINMLRRDLRAANMAAMLDGYARALLALSDSIVAFDGATITLRHEYVDAVLSYKILNRVVNLLDFSRKAFAAYITHGKAGKVSLDVVAKELASKLRREFQITFNRRELEDPRGFLFLKTESGPISLNKQDALIETLRKLKGNDHITVEPLASALNEVYLVTINGDRMVAKKFADWYNLKWFILNVAAYGTKSFSLSGKTRLTNEYVINTFLAEHGIPVPEIVSISIPDRLLVERYLEGTNVQDTVTGVASTPDPAQEHVALAVGQLLARIHAVDVTVGDCKPENFIVAPDGTISVLDLEQGERHGDKAWDVAEFLYFSGHFGIAMTEGLQRFVEHFLEGYRRSGNPRVLAEAASANYYRVFLAWTPMPIIRKVATQLKKYAQ
jgi:tRNA A-37 threonylcarbamoyl transferase component Bud32/predicted nucleotidyltransferase